MEQNNQNGTEKKQLAWTAPVAANGSSVGRYVGTFVVGVVIGVLLSWGYAAMQNGGEVAKTQTSQNGASQNAGQNGGSIAADVQIGENGTVQTLSLQVPSPQKAGLSVSITKASISKPTWVVVYESIDGTLGNVLGAHLFHQTGSGTVTLLRATTAGQEYFVGMSPDNGDRKYSKAADKPTGNGSPEVVRFVAN